MENRLTQKQKELIESFGVIQENMGLSPAAARVNALLVVSDDVELTFDEIKDGVSLSKSATSNAINYLLASKHIGYKTKPGDRKRYFFSKLGQWQNSFIDSMEGLTNYNQIMKEIHKHRSDATTDFNEQLKDFTEFIDYYQKESIKLIRNWKK